MRHSQCAAGGQTYPALTAADITHVAREFKLSPPWLVDPATSAERINDAISHYLEDGLSLPAKERLAAEVEAVATRWKRALLHEDDKRRTRMLRELRLLLSQSGAEELFGTAAIDEVLHDPPSEKVINNLLVAASEHRRRLDREQRRVAGKDGWPVYTGSKPRHRPQERAWRFLAETLLDEVWVHHSGRELKLTVDASHLTVVRKSAAADFGARLLEVCAEHFSELAKELAKVSPADPIVHRLCDRAEKLSGTAPRLRDFIEERRRQRRQGKF